MTEYKFPTNFNSQGFNLSSPIVQNMFINNPPPFPVEGFNTPPQPMMNFGYGYNMPQNSNVGYMANNTSEYVDPNARYGTITPFVQGVSQPPNYGGYNNYYGNTFAGYYNPYMQQYQMQQQAQLEAIQAKQRADMESRIWKAISRGLNSISKNPIEDIEEHVKQYDPIDFEEKRKELQNYKKLVIKVKVVRGDKVICDPERDGYYRAQEYLEALGRRYELEEYRMTERLVNAELYGIPYNLELARKVEVNNMIYDAHKADYPDSMGLAEYLSKAGKIYSEALVYEDRMRRLDMMEKYNESRFKGVVRSSQQQLTPFVNNTNDLAYNMVFTQPPEVSGVYPGPTLGSLEIKMPDHIRSKYEQRRQEFLNKIKVGR